MGELSKTADAARKAVERSQKKAVKELTTEERIANIRKNVAAGLYVPAMEIGVLLDAYDITIRALTDISQIRIIDAMESNAHKATEELETIPR